MDDDLNDWGLDGEEPPPESEELEKVAKSPKKSQARQKYDELMEEKRLKAQLDDDFENW